MTCSRSGCLFIEESPADLLVDDGVVCEDALQRELITRLDLEAAAHKQGFTSLEEIERAELEPGGGICFFAKKPTAEVTRHQEVLARLDQISAQVAALRS